MKELVVEQKKEKSLLRTPHHNLKLMKIKSQWGNVYEESGTRLASSLMMRCLSRRNKITQLHIEYNKLRGKPFDMYFYKN